MQRTLSTSADVDSVIAAALDGLLALPDWEDVSVSNRQALLEQLGEDDTVLNLLVLRECTYEHADYLDGEQPEEQIMHDECFRAAEWLNTTLRLYIGAQAVEILDTEQTVEDVFTAGGVEA